jgi:hypothetical protein
VCSKQKSESFFQWVPLRINDLQIRFPFSEKNFQKIDPFLPVSTTYGGMLLANRAAWSPLGLWFQVPGRCCEPHGQAISVQFINQTPGKKGCQVRSRRVGAKVQDFYPAGVCRKLCFIGATSTWNEFVFTRRTRRELFPGAVQSFRQFSPKVEHFSAVSTCKDPSKHGRHASCIEPFARAIKSAIEVSTPPQRKLFICL